jgi:NagD protein
MRSYGAYFFDLDGTLYHSGRLIPGAKETLSALRRQGAKVVFLTNNGRHTGDLVAARLREIGIEARTEEVLTAADATVAELAQDAPDARVYALSEAPFLDALREAGLRTAETPAETDLVVVGFDTKLTFDHLLFAHEAIRNGARLWATNPDVCYPTTTGESPHTGAILAAVEASSGLKAERVVGKPAAGFFHVARRRAGVPVGDCLVVGDRLDTDILGAHRAGMDSALVLTGIATRDALARSRLRPTYVLESVFALRTDA